MTRGRSPMTTICYMPEWEPLEVGEVGIFLPSNLWLSYRYLWDWIRQLWHLWLWLLFCWWRDISENAVTTLTLASKKIFLMPWLLLMCLLFRSGNIRWYDRWMLTKEGKGTEEARFRWRSLAATNSLHIVEYMSRFLKWVRLFKIYQI